jgi:GxxExxY protein
VADHQPTNGLELTAACRTERDRDNLLSERIIGAAVEVHRHLGPGLLEAAYQECLTRELGLRGLDVARQVSLDLHYKGLVIRGAFRAELLVAGRVLVELLAIERLDDGHRARLLTYLRLSDLHLGLLINFNTPILSKGVRRVVNGY